MSGEGAQLVGESAAFRHAVALIERMAHYDAPVLIQGETGTGKELAARAIHYRSCRRSAPFVPLNCGAMPDALVESELFGCERGAFTDARQGRVGLVHAAEGGTLFLDELDALPPRAQVALLRFLQDHTYRPVGGTRECRGNVRVIAAASPRLQALLGSGGFRDDLAFRLNVLSLHMPPLRERPGDPTLLARHFAVRHARRHGLPPRELHPCSIDWLESYAWPGNVRELDNLVQRCLMLSDDECLQLGPGDVRGIAAVAGAAWPVAGPAAPAAPPAGPWARTGEPAAGHAAVLPFHDAREHALERFERQYLEQVMRVAGGNVTHAARLSGKERSALGKLLKKHGISRAGFRSASPP